VRAAQAGTGLPWAELYARFVVADASVHVESSPSSVLAYAEPRAKFAHKMQALGV
jgi:hypothetical protein